MLKLTLPSGFVIEGPAAQIQAILGAVEVGGHLSGFYRSESKGYRAIAEMHSEHLKNAILKRYRVWVSDLSKLEPEDVIDAVQDGNKDLEFLELCKELWRRKVRGKL